MAPLARPPSAILKQQLRYSFGRSVFSFYRRTLAFLLGKYLGDGFPGAGVLLKSIEVCRRIGRIGTTICRSSQSARNAAVHRFSLHHISYEWLRVHAFAVWERPDDALVHVGCCNRGPKMRLTTLLFAFGLLPLCGMQSSAADAQRGAAIAERWCSTCHVVSAGQTEGNTEAPPFSEIKDRRNFDAGKVALFLLAPHPPMRGISLSRNDAADLAAYIAKQ
jgi:mono/diheme cytochrome c family protein